MNLEMTKTPSPEDIKFLTKQISLEGKSNGVLEPFGIFIRNDNGELVAGCNGALIFGSIYTDQLWVHLDLRGESLGKQLMEKVHEYGMKHGCGQATVSTMSFQAQAFYEKLGYGVDYRRGGYSNGAQCIFMSKKLSVS